MLRVALSELRAGPVDTTGEVPPDDPSLAEVEVKLLAPVAVRGRFSSAGEGKYYWRMHFDTVVRAECRRCLASVELPVSEGRGLIFSADDDETPEGDGVYIIPERSPVVELDRALREELLLAVPQFVECRADCLGLCPRCGANLNDGPCDCPPETDSRWDALRAQSRSNHQKG